MKKAIILVYTLLMIISLLLTSCGGPMQESSALHVPESSEVEAQTSPEDPQEVLNKQIDEVQLALADITPTQKLESGTERENVMQQITDTIAGLGYPVVQYHRDMPNYEQIVAFFERADKGEHVFITVYSINVNKTATINVSLYGHDGTGFYEQGASLSQNEDFTWEKNLYDRQQLKSVELTANGNLMKYADDPGNSYGFRVVPQQMEYTDAYWKYVWLVDVQSDGVINQTWGQDFGFRNLSWEYVFEEIWGQENDRRLLGEGSPYYHGNTEEPESGDAAIVPADVVEETLQKYFNVQVETLRNMADPIREGNEAILYNPEDNTYRIWGFRGGGYKPTVEVWGITNNPDGSVSLDLAHIALDFGNDGNMHSTLTVMPQPNGGFKYISNIFSEYTVKEKVEYALMLAESADFLHQGGLVTTGDSVEKNGYHYAAIDLLNQGYRDKVKLGGLTSVESLERWFRQIFEKETAEKYIRKMLEVPLYIDGTNDGRDALFVNQDVNGSPIAQGDWTMEDFVVLENTPDIIKVQMRLDMPDGSRAGILTLVPGERHNWVLTDSFEGRIDN